jgi:hypothetical protein
MSTIPRSEVVKQYLTPGTAEQIAYALTFHWRTKIDAFVAPLRARDVQHIWDEEYEINPVMREMGERPLRGFPETDERLTVARKLLEAA